MKIIIFGASSGLGKCFLDILLKNPKNEIVATYNKTFLSKYKNHNLFFIKCNFENPKSIIYTLKKSIQILQRIDLIIICSGYFAYDSLKKNIISSIKKFFFINFYSNIIINNFFMKKKNIKKLKKKVKIVNIGSSSSYKSFLNTSLYCASKSALLSFIRSIELKKKSKIKNYIFSMGTMDTKMGELIKNKKKKLDPMYIASHILKNINKNKFEFIYSRARRQFL